MFLVTAEPIDPESLLRELRHPRAGACATFAGQVRDLQGEREVTGLDYEALVPLAEKEGERIMEEARRRFAVLDIRAVHRTGSLAVGELAVWIGVSAEHRDAAFSACRFVIDEAKARLPIWKKEHYRNGDSVWVNCATRGDFAGKTIPKPGRPAENA